MNNEIKEILAYFEEYIKITDMHDSEPMLNWKDLKIVLDYITNLQEEVYNYRKLGFKHLSEQNKKLQQENERLIKLIEDNTILVKDENGDYQELNINPLDYKSRNDKAIEYIKKNSYGWETKYFQDEALASELLEILGDKGEDK